VWLVELTEVPRKLASLLGGHCQSSVVYFADVVVAAASVVRSMKNLLYYRPHDGSGQPPGSLYEYLIYGSVAQYLPQSSLWIVLEHLICHHSSKNMIHLVVGKQTRREPANF